MLDLNWDQKLRGEVSIERVMEVTRHLATWVRLSGSDAEREAVEYLRGVLDDLGVPTELTFHHAYAGSGWSVAICALSPLL